MLRMLSGDSLACDTENEKRSENNFSLKSIEEEKGTNRLESTQTLKKYRSPIHAESCLCR